MKKSKKSSKEIPRKVPVRQDKIRSRSRSKENKPKRKI